MFPTTWVHLHVLQVLHGPVERLPHDLVPVDRVIPVLHSQEVVFAVGPIKDAKCFLSNFTTCFGEVLGNRLEVIFVGRISYGETAPYLRKYSKNSLRFCGGPWGPWDPSVASPPLDGSGSILTGEDFALGIFSTLWALLDLYMMPNKYNFMARFFVITLCTRVPFQSSWQAGTGEVKYWQEASNHLQNNRPSMTTVLAC